MKSRTEMGSALGGVDVAEAVGDLLGAGDLEALAVLDGVDEVRGFEQRVVGAGVEPGDAAAEELGAELAAFEVPAVDVGDFELAAGAGLEGFGDVDDLAVVEVDAGDGVARLGLEGFSSSEMALCGRRRTRRRRSARDPDGVGEDGGAGGVRGGVAEGLGEVVAVEDVVAEDEAAAFAGEELLADEEGLGEAVGRGLDGVLDLEAPLLAGRRAAARSAACLRGWR
jgi:hypothetical protein